MNLQDFQNDSADIMNKFKASAAALRLGRITPAIAEDISVEYYGSRMPLKQIASINMQPPNLLLIEPWDKGAIEPIEKALRAANIGASPVVEGHVIRLPFPSMTEERRKEAVKALREKAEEARIQLRKSREETKKKIQAEFEEDIISEDEKFRFQEELQKKVDEFNHGLEEFLKQKEEEIMKV